MRLIKLKKMPNQKILFEHGNNRWEITIKTAIHSTVVDVVMNNEVIILGQRILAGTPFIKDATHRQAGNFYISGNDPIEWCKFGDTQLLYFTPEYLEREQYKLLSEEQKRRVQ